MAPDKRQSIKRSTSPTQPPSWVAELLRSNQLFSRELQLHDSSLREIRLVSLENQRLLRSLASSNVANSPSRSCRSISRTSSVHSVQRTSSSASIHTNRSTSRSSVKQPTRRVARTATTARVDPSIQKKNAEVRDAAVPMPRVPRSTQNPRPKICWYHKNFGKTTVHCVQPCDFVAPVIPIIAKNKSSQQPADTSTEPKPTEPTNDESSLADAQVSAIITRTPLERAGEVKSLTDSDSSSSSASTASFKSKDAKATDWNKLVKRKLSSSDSE